MSRDTNRLRDSIGYLRVKVYTGCALSPATLFIVTATPQFPPTKAVLIFTTPEG